MSSLMYQFAAVIGLSLTIALGATAVSINEKEVFWISLMALSGLVMPCVHSSVISSKQLTKEGVISYLSYFTVAIAAGLAVAPFAFGTSSSDSISVAVIVTMLGGYAAMVVGLIYPGRFLGTASAIAYFNVVLLSVNFTEGSGSSVRFSLIVITVLVTIMEICLIRQYKFNTSNPNH